MGFNIGQRIFSMGVVAMWWLLTVLAIVAFLIFCLLYAEFGPGAAKKRREPADDANTNYAVTQALSNGRRNQSGPL